MYQFEARREAVESNSSQRFCDTSRRYLRSAASQLAFVRDGSMQPPLQVLHAGGGLIVWLPREDVLTHEENGGPDRLFHGSRRGSRAVDRGEPLLRRNLPQLIRLLLQNQRVTDIALTTNGILLADQADALYEAGLHRITVSLDTLRPERFLQLTRHDEFARVVEGN